MKTKAFLITNIFATIVVAVMAVAVVHIKAQQSPNCPPGQPQGVCPFPDEDYTVFFPHPNDDHWFFQM